MLENRFSVSKAKDYNNDFTSINEISVISKQPSFSQRLPRRILPAVVGLKWRLLPLFRLRLECVMHPMGDAFTYMDWMR